MLEKALDWYLNWTIHCEYNDFGKILSLRLQQNHGVAIILSKSLLIPT
jgi:hypothetical protein